MAGIARWNYFKNSSCGRLEQGLEWSLQYSSQSGIARGAMTEKDLKEIHGNMEKELEKHNIKIEKIYYCPHGWDEGCECRKPKPGMLFQAAREYNLDLSKSTFIGDDERDLQAYREMLPVKRASAYRMKSLGGSLCKL